MLSFIISAALLLTPTPWVATPIAPFTIAARMETVSPEQAIERLFTSGRIRRNWFSDSFSAQVSPQQIQSIVNELERSLGMYQSVQNSDAGFLVEFERGTVPTQIALDDRGRIVGLLFQPPTQAIDLDEAIAQLRALPGETHLLVLRDGVEIAAHNADQPLAVGSAFKLAVLATLRNQIADGDRQWDEVVELQPKWKSLPSGILQGWADGTPVTIATLATLMISLSDNTATDALIHLVGREAIEAVATAQNRPLLTTREAFVLKNPANATLLEQYRSGNEAQRREFLQAIPDAPLPGIETFLGNPIAIDIEWFFTAQELCSLMGQVEDLPMMSVNPGLANPQDWQRIAFKGGSEPGVFNLTTWLEAADGSTYCVTATWNNPDATLNELQFTTLYQGILAGLRSPEP